MSAVTITTFKTTVGYLNSPIIKEGVKNVAGLAAFAFGIYEIYDDVNWLIHKWQAKPLANQEEKEGFSWLKTAGKVVMVAARISLILSCFSSRPGLIICSWTAGKIFTEAQLVRFFGANTIFAVNPWHPKHIVSISACILGIPAALKAVYDGSVWVKHKVTRHETAKDKEGQAEASEGRFLTDKKIGLMVSFNTIFSRPVLHWGNILSRILLRRA